MASNLMEALDDLRSYAQEISFMGYCVARGIKPLYIVRFLDFDSVETMRNCKDVILEHIRMLACEGDPGMELTSCTPIPYVTETRDASGKPRLLCTICSHLWVCDMVEWLYNGNPPEHLRDAITGLLCGYDAASIEKFVDTRVRNREPLVDATIGEEEAEDGVVYVMEPGGRLRRATDRHGQLFANPSDHLPVKNDIDSLLQAGWERIFSEEGRCFMDELPYGDSKDGKEE